MRLVLTYIFMSALLFSACALNAENSLKITSLTNSNTSLSNANILPTAENQYESPIEKYFVSQEYALTNKSEPHPPTEWEKQQFNVKAKSGFSLKSKNQVPNWENAYYRFSFINETYETEQEAKTRITKLYVEPPAVPMSEPDKAFPLRKGFSVGNNVYIITTDVSSFMPELERLTSGLKGQLDQKTRTNR